MSLFDLAVGYNLLIRTNDKKIPIEGIQLFKKSHYEQNFSGMISEYQLKLEQINASKLEIICDLAKNIVNAQYFCDGNHRTALLLCYNLVLFHCHQYPRIQPMWLYAAIDFEYLKSMHALDSEKGLFFSSNGIHTAIESRAMNNITHGESKDVMMNRLIDAVKEMPAQIEHLAKQFNANQRTASEKAQTKLFRQFAGFRPTMCHSTAVDNKSYLDFLTKKQLITDGFNPNLDLHRPSIKLFSMFSNTTDVSKSASSNESTEFDDPIPSNKLDK